MFKADSSPSHIDIDLSSKCNLRCTFCHLSFFDPKAWEQLSHEQFREISPFLERARSITLFSKYEPLTCRDFVKIFDDVSGFGAETYFSTNGILLDGDIIEAIVGRLTYLTVSVTGFTGADYTRFMGLDRLDQVRDNLARLNEAKKARGTRHPVLRISTLGMLETVGGLPAAIDFAREFDAEEGVQVTYLKAHGKEFVDSMPLANPKSFSRAARKAADYAAALGVKFELQGGAIDEIEEETRELGHRLCDMPWRRLSLQPNGDVYPCPLSYRTVGNFFETPLEDIWDGEALARFREGVNDRERMNEDCRNCTHCRHRSVLAPNQNDFSDASEYAGGMKRK